MVEVISVDECKIVVKSFESEMKVQIKYTMESGLFTFQALCSTVLVKSLLILQISGENGFTRLYVTVNRVS